MTLEEALERDVEIVLSRVRAHRSRRAKMIAVKIPLQAIMALAIDYFAPGEPQATLKRHFGDHEYDPTAPDGLIFFFETPEEAALFKLRHG